MAVKAALAVAAADTGSIIDLHALRYQLRNTVRGYQLALTMQSLCVVNAGIYRPEIHIIADEPLVLAQPNKYKQQERMNHISPDPSAYLAWRLNG